jgi:hypothetical protein
MFAFRKARLSSADFFRIRSFGQLHGPPPSKRQPSHVEEALGLGPARPTISECIPRRTSEALLDHACRNSHATITTEGNATHPQQISIRPSVSLTISAAEAMSGGSCESNETHGPATHQPGRSTSIGSEQSAPQQIQALQLFEGVNDGRRLRVRRQASCRSCITLF